MDKVEVLEQEKTLQFEAFTHEMGLEIALRVINKVKDQAPKSVGIRIVHNDLLILHYLMDGRKESPWLNRKEKTVLDSGHSSLYTFLFMDEVPEYKEWERSEEYAICGGGFPIIEDGQVTGVICVSGLEHLEDHRLIVESMEEVLAAQY
ncbi:heme-binding protein [Trichococcus alkaliphilus]|uniref:heme-binding protein n=1 Tax=Trichococcus alkaliphilus TaxID=2052943 RepID=UPI000D0AC8AF|nr:heme-binding protein [Trichococcus alkaliphilus]